MPIDPELLAILVCPETRQPLTPAEPALLAKLNVEIRARRLRNRGGQLVEKEIREGLVRQDGRFLYLIDDEIAIMLEDQAIELA
ncbi:MAG: hypothetical protein R3F35_08325 [Myxococcota bacterium]